jgi:hypothetical protein
MNAKSKEMDVSCVSTGLVHLFNHSLVAQAGDALV